MSEPVDKSNRPAGALRRIPVRALSVGVVFMVVFSYLAVWSANRAQAIVTATQLSSFAVMFSLVLVLALNPLLALVRLRSFTRAELFLIYIMTTVPAGLAVFGYVHQVLPLAGGLHHPKWNTRQSKWDEQVAPNLDGSLFVQDDKAVDSYVRGLRSQDKEAFPVLLKKPSEEWSQYGGRVLGYAGHKLKGVSPSLGDKLLEWADAMQPEGLVVQKHSERAEARPFAGDVPWRAWIKPLLYWGALCVVFILFFYALNELIFRQWFSREKLTFPLAELAETLLDTESGPAGSRLPVIYRNPVFWVGLGIGFTIMFYNGIVSARWFQGLEPFPLQQANNAMESKFQFTVLEGLNPDFRFHIFFVVIGLAFLLPTGISFSVWFFYLVMKLQLLAAVWMGHGNNSRSFESSWVSNSNFMTSQGGGALVVFGLVYLWKVRYEMVAGLYRLAGRKAAGRLGAQDIRRYTWPSTLFWITSALLVLFMMRGNVSLPLAALVYVGFLLLTVAMVRVVCECGVIAFQPNFGVLHFARVFGLFRFGVFQAGRGIATVVVFLSSMFFDTKTFVAPTLMNGRYLAEKGGIRRRSFLAAVLLGVVVTVGIAMLVSVVMSYDRGVGQMRQWFWTVYPRQTFDSIVNMQNSLDDFTRVDTTMATHFGIGALVCAALIFFRQFVFWLPHPIGIIMFTNPLMRAYWFSFFLGWICKKTAVRYCDNVRYRIVKGFFIGLILGELLAVATGLLLGMMGYPDMQLTLNR